MTAGSPSAESVSAGGWYPYGVAGRVGEWDGQAWSSRSREDSAVGTPPAWHRRILGFLGRAWFWLFVAGYVVTMALGLAAGNDAKSAGWFVILTLTSGLVMAAVVLLFEPHARFAELGALRVVVVWGLISGAVALGVVKIIEGWLEPRLGLSLAADLWVSGPIEETGKLLVPVLLWVFGKGVFRDPRAGFLLALISGAVFGAVEAGQYSAIAGDHAPAMMTLSRPIADVTHSIWTAIAATMIWLAAHRASRLITVAGFLGWVMAVLLHSVHDGLGAFGRSGDRDTLTADLTFDTLAQAYREGLVLFVFSLVYAVISFLVLRHFAARELTPPTAIDSNPPHWRPRLATWGVPKDQRAKAAAST